MILDALKATIQGIDTCVTLVSTRDDGFFEVRGVHHPHLLRKYLAAQGVRFISFVPCGCFDRSKVKPKMKSKGAQEQRFLHLKNHKRGEPRVPNHPGPKEGYYK